MDKNFRCPNCQSKVPFREVFTFKKDHITWCRYCKNALAPKNPRSWNFGFFIGSLGVTIPALIALRSHHNFLIAAMLGILSGTLVVFAVAIIVYLTTEFRIRD